jgi:phosphoserine phosphatase
MRRLGRVACVVFDCDSTLSAVEGIVELARGRAATEVAALTESAMRGTIPLEHVYGARLACTAPSRADVAALGALYIERLVPDAAEVVRALQSEHIEVRIMSGGLRPAVEILGAALNIRPRHIAAVDVRFAEDGAYAGFDEAAPLARSGGKRTMIEVWRREIGGAVMFVGDGITDLETREVADLFVAYAGVAERPAVLAAADIVIRSASLAPVIPLALGGQRPRHSDDGPLYDKGLQLLESVYRSYLNGTEP